jgi:hypothetical protein
VRDVFPRERRAITQSAGLGPRVPPIHRLRAELVVAERHGDDDFYDLLTLATLVFARCLETPGLRWVAIIDSHPPEPLQPGEHDPRD